MGRPAKYPEARKRSVLLPNPLIETLEAEADRRGMSVSDVIVERLSSGASPSEAPPETSGEEVHRCHFRVRGASGLLRCDCGRIK